MAFNPGFSTFGSSKKLTRWLRRAEKVYTFDDTGIDNHSTFFIKDFLRVHRVLRVINPGVPLSERSQGLHFEVTAAALL